MHAPGNGATLQTVAAAFPEQALRVFAEDGHVARAARTNAALAAHAERLVPSRRGVRRTIAGRRIWSRCGGCGRDSRPLRAALAGMAAGRALPAAAAVRDLDGGVRRLRGRAAAGRGGRRSRSGCTATSTSSAAGGRAIPLRRGLDLTAAMASPLTRAAPLPGARGGHPRRAGAAASGGGRAHGRAAAADQRSRDRGAGRGGRGRARARRPGPLRLRGSGDRGEGYRPVPARGGRDPRPLRRPRRLRGDRPRAARHRPAPPMPVSPSRSTTEHLSRTSSCAGWRGRTTSCCRSGPAITISPPAAR